MSLLETAETILSNNKQSMSFVELYQAICEVKDLSEEEKNDLISQVYADFIISGKFVYVGDDLWDLKSRLKTKDWDKDYYDEYPDLAEELVEDDEEDEKKLDEEDSENDEEEESEDKYEEDLDFDEFEEDDEEEEDIDYDGFDDEEDDFVEDEKRYCPRRRRRIRR